MKNVSWMLACVTGLVAGLIAGACTPAQKAEAKTVLNTQATVCQVVANVSGDSTARMICDVDSSLVPVIQEFIGAKMGALHAAPPHDAGDGKPPGTK